MDEEVGTPGGNCSTSGSIFKYELMIDHWSKAGVAAGSNFLVITQMLTLTR